ncbi:MAG: hypothetical protein HRF49_01430 [bacterium]|jgi:hypothetical protein
MNETVLEIERDVFLGEGTPLVLRDGRKLTVPRWSARKALSLGRKIAEAVSIASQAEGGGGGKAILFSLPLIGEVVCETLGEDESFLDTITKDDLAEIALAIVKQEFMSEHFLSLSKKAAALLRSSRSAD